MSNNVIQFPEAPVGPAFEDITEQDAVCVVLNWAAEMSERGLMPDRVRSALYGIVLAHSDAEVADGP